MSQTGEFPKAMKLAELSLQHVYEAQKTLKEARIKFAVTGDIGQSFHGVDIVTHDIELCIPTAQRENAIRALKVRDTEYEARPDLVEPDFYHPYKKGAACFRILTVEPSMDLFLVTDRALAMDLSSARTLESGMTTATAHRELQEYCRGVPDYVLSRIAWPTLESFLNGWLTLAAQVPGEEILSIWLMYAERLIDANDVDSEWFEKYTGDPICRKLAEELLEGKTRRIEGSRFD